MRKAAIPTERIVGLWAKGIRSEMNEDEMECRVAAMKWKRYRNVMQAERINC
jgi:hypothetical protein